MSDAGARRFFGLLLSRNKLTGDQLLQSVTACEQCGTGDPRPYLTRAAAGVRTRQKDPGLLCTWT